MASLDSIAPPNAASSSASEWRRTARAVLPAWSLLALALCGIGLFAHDAARHAMRQTIASDLRAVALLKSRQIDHWLDTQLDEAATLASRHFSVELQNWLADGAYRPELRQHVLGQLQTTEHLSQRRQYRVRAIDDGRILFAHPNESEFRTDRPEARRLALAAAQFDAPQFDDLHFAADDPTQSPALGMFIPCIILNIHKVLSIDDLAALSNAASAGDSPRPATTTELG